jgi:hypothetical protein
MIHREMGLGGWDGSFWSRGVGLPLGNMSSLFIPQPEAGSMRAKMTRNRRIMKVSGTSLTANCHAARTQATG